MTEEESLPALPKGWVWAKLGLLARQINPGFPSGKWKRDDEQAIPHLRPMNIDSKGEIDLSNLKYVSRKDYDPLLKGDVLFNNTNSPKLLGKTAVIKKDTNWAYSNHMTRIRLVSSDIEPAFVSSYLQNLFVKGFFQMHCVHHVNQASVNTGFLAEKVNVPIPPFPEQGRIVCKLEELFTRLDAGVESLRNVKAQLQLYRQAVLKHAFNGKLTEEWRKTHKNTIEPATKLLEKIRQEQKKEGNFQEPTKIDTSELPEIPEGWEWTNFSSITRNFDNLRIPVKKKDRKSMRGIYPYYGASGIIDYVDNFLFDGEYLLISEDGANLLARTKPIAFQAKGKFWVNNHAHVVKTMGGMQLAFLEHYFNYFSLTKFITGTAQPKLPQRAMNRIPISIPPLNEQYEIVEEIERSFSVANQIEKIIEGSLVRSNQLRQNILKTAFEGKLVAQDPSDEPAERLLERIRKEKEGQSNQNKGKTRSKTGKRSQRRLDGYVE